VSFPELQSSFPGGDGEVIRSLKSKVVVFVPASDARCQTYENV
jgi:hypothetical protein